MRLIDADKLKTEFCIGDDLETMTFAGIKETIDEQPTVEAEGYKRMNMKLDEMQYRNDRLQAQNENLCGQVKALAFAIRVNGISGNEVQYE